MAGNIPKEPISEETKVNSNENNGLEFALGAMGSVFFNLIILAILLIIYRDIESIPSIWAVLWVLVNVGICLYFSITHRYIAFGMLAVYGVAIMIVTCLRVTSLGECFGLM